MSRRVSQVEQKLDFLKIFLGINIRPGNLDLPLGNRPKPECCFCYLCASGAKPPGYPKNARTANFKILKRWPAYGDLNV